jgi:hypothetical protein
MLSFACVNGSHPRTFRRPSISSWWVLRALVLGVLSPFGLMSVGAPVADAGSYRVWSCTDANGASVPTTDGTSGWSIATSPGGSPQLGGAAKENRCSSADPNVAGRYLLTVLTAQAGMSGEWADGWSFAAPASTALRQIELWWQGSMSDSAGFHIHIESPASGYFSILTNHNYPWGGDPPYADVNYWSLPGAAYPYTLPTPAPSSFHVLAVCQADCQSRAPLSAWFKIYRARITLEDDTPPAGDVSGPLVERPVLRGTLSATINGRDTGGGVYLARLYVDDQLVDQSTFPSEHCRDHHPGGDPYEFAAPKPCPATAATTLSLDTRRLSGDALHRLRVDVVDAAGNTTTLANQGAYVLGSPPDGFYDAASHKWFNPDANADTPRSANGKGAGPAKPVLNFARRRGSKHSRRTTYIKSRVVSLRGRPTVVGRLRDPGRHAIVGARVWLGECAKGGTCRITQGPFITSRRGGFSARLAAGRPTRRVHLLYFPWTDSNEVYTAKPLRLGVRARVTLRVRPRVVSNGQSVRFAGSMRVPILASGLTGTLQTLDGATWRVFRVVHIDSSGRFSARYRFRRSSGVRYRFRLRISGRQPGMRYDSGISPTVHVRVR